MKPWCTTAAAAALFVGLGALAVPGASAAPKPDGLDRAARLNGLSRAQLEAKLDRDPSLVLDRFGRLKYVEPAPQGVPETQAAPADGPLPDAQTFLLHSKPGAQRVLFLDFTGFNVEGTRWDQSYDLPNEVSSYDLDGDPASFNGTEHTNIQLIWQSVAEDFAAHDVDVTTEDPGIEALRRTDASDVAYGSRALVTSDPHWNTGMCGGCSGQAYVGVIDQYANKPVPGYPGYVDPTPHEQYQPAIVLAKTLSNDPHLVAQTTSHELGHTAGLDHDGTLTSGYYSGVSGGLWAPIMGVSFYNPVSQWSKGEYAGANQTQDDFTVMASHGVSLRTDEAADSGEAAAELTGPGTTTGYITSASDKDWYGFALSCTGTLSAAATPAARGANLDVLLRLRDSAGSVLQASDPSAARASRDRATGLGATVARSLSPGSYYLEVDGTGTGTWADGGYSDYGSVGAYSLTTTGCISSSTTVPSPPTAPSAPETATTTVDHTAASVTLSWTPPSSDGGAAVAGFQVTVDGAEPVDVGDVGSHTFTGLARGPHTFTVAATNEAGTGPARTATATIRPVAAAPASVTVTPGSASLAASWTAPADAATSAPITAYRVWLRRAGVPDVPRQVTGARSHTWTSLAPGTAYAVGVQALTGNEAGPIAWAPPRQPLGRPGAPTSVRALPGKAGGPSTARVSWQPPAQLGGLPVTGYQILALRLKAGTVVTRKRLAVLSPRTRSVSLPLARGRWRFKVRASNSEGWGAHSARTRSVAAR